MLKVVEVRVLLVPPRELVVVLMLVRDEVLTMGPGRPKQLVPVHFRSKKLRTVSVWV